MFTVIVVKLRARVRRCRKLERQSKVAIAQRFQKGIVAIRPIVFEGFVDHIPGIAFSLEMAHDVGNVRLHYRGHGVFGPGSR